MITDTNLLKSVLVDEYIPGPVKKLNLKDCIPRKSEAVCFEQTLTCQDKKENQKRLCYRK
jgi:hypothetical protein